MSDYGLSVQFGVSVTPDAYELEQMTALVDTAEQTGLARLVWSSAPRVSFTGRHYQVQGYQPGPPPAHLIGIWLGVRGPQMLRLTGRLADGWVCPLNIYVPPEQAPAAQALIDQAAARAGRAPSEVRRIYNVLGAIDAGPRGGRGLIGSVQTWAESLARWTIELGFDTFIFWPLDPSPAQFRRFALDVAPRTRDVVARARQETRR